MKKLNYKNLLNSKILTKNKGITLIALIVSIIVILILASVSVTVFSNSNIIKKSKFAGETYQNKINEEEKAMQNYDSTMNEYTIADSGRDTITISKEEYENLINRGVDIIFETSSSGTTSVNLNSYNKSFSDYDLLLVEFNAGGGASQLILHTQKTNTSSFQYTSGSSYVRELITADKESNTITLNPRGNDSDWNRSSYSYIIRILGIKL